MAELMTLGDIARELGVARSRLGYAVEKVGLQERGRAGILRLFSRDQIPAMRAALETVRSYGHKRNESSGDGRSAPPSSAGTERTNDAER